MSRVAVIGGGLAGCASAARLAKLGHEVTLIEALPDLGGIPQVWTVASEGGWPQPVTALDDPVHFLHWSPDGSAIAFTGSASSLAFVGAGP